MAIYLRKTDTFSQSVTHDARRFAAGEIFHLGACSTDDMMMVARIRKLVICMPVLKIYALRYIRAAQGFKGAIDGNGIKLISHTLAYHACRKRFARIRDERK